MAWVRCAVGLLLLACACGGPTPRTGEREREVVHVVDAGSEPRRTLRYEPAVGAPERFALQMKVRTATELTNTVLEEGRRTADFPTVEIVGRIAATSRTPTGATRVTWEVEDARVLDDLVDPTLRAPVEAEAAALKGFRMAWSLSPAGRIAEVELDPRTTPAARDRVSRLRSLHGAGVIFPDVAIGTGAVWQIRSRPTIDGVVWNDETTYQLRQLTDASAVVEVTATLRAEPQVLRVEPSATTKLTGGATTATAVLTVPLRGLVPTLNSHSTSEASYSIVRKRLHILSTVRTETLFSQRRLP